MIVLFTFAGTLISAILGTDRSLSGAVSAIFAVGLMHVVVPDLKRRFAWFGRLVDGTPNVVFECGHWHDDRMRALRMRAQDVMTAVGQKGLMRLEQMRYAVLERDGRVSVIPQKG